MANKRKQIKAKEPVRLRIKSLSNGNKSLYLDCYRDGERSYEFLKLYLVPERDEVSKRQNAATIQAANAIKAQRIIELASTKAGLRKASSRSKISVLGWVKVCIEDKIKQNVKTNVYVSLTKVIEAFGRGETRLNNVDESWVSDFIDFMRLQYKTSVGKPLSENSITLYLKLLSSCFKQAVKDGLIPSNPYVDLDRNDKTKKGVEERSFLTIEELGQMINAECSHFIVKQAFLFSCFCGLRLSDVKLLKWSNINTNNGKTYATLIMKKTKTQLNIHLSDEALKWLPSRPDKSKPDDCIFNLPTTIQTIVARWAAAAGITKKVTYHVSRHTFATMMLTLGADLYTVSKLLGHHNVQVTQIYARIVDKKKDDAVDLANGLFDKKQ